MSHYFCLKSSIFFKIDVLLLSGSEHLPAILTSSAKIFNLLPSKNDEQKCQRQKSGGKSSEEQKRS